MKYKYIYNYSYSYFSENIVENWIDLLFDYDEF
jgi:hypothetical protein